MNETLLDNPYMLVVVGTVIGSLLTIIVDRVLNKRGLLTYVVRHDRVGVSANDAIFGSVRVLWNDNPVDNLYTSTIELTNSSLTDFENVHVRAFTTDTHLLTERSEIVGTTRTPMLDQAFMDRLAVAPGQQATRDQLELYLTSREYRIETLNRGQVVRFAFLNAATTPAGPSIWLDVLQKGVRLEYRVAFTEILGVPQPSASVIGALAGFAFVALVVSLVDSVVWAAVLSLLFGFLAQLPGALLIRLWRRVRAFFGD